MVKVTKLDGGYVLAQKRDGKWEADKPSQPLKAGELYQLFGRSWKSVSPLGLVTGDGQAALLKVKSGWSNGRFTCQTGYFFMQPSGPVELAKTESRTLVLPSLAPVEMPAATPKAAAMVVATSGAAVLVVRPMAHPQRATPDALTTSALVAARPAETPAATATVSSTATQARLESTKPLTGTQAVNVEDPVVQSPSSTPAIPTSPTTTPALTPAPSPSSAQLSVSKPRIRDASGSKHSSTGAQAPSSPPSTLDSKLQTLQHSRQRAETARTVMIQTATPAQSAIRDNWLLKGDDKMKNSRMFETDGKLDAAIIWTQQAEEAYRDGGKLLGVKGR